MSLADAALLAAVVVALVASPSVMFLLFWRGLVKLRDDQLVERVLNEHGSAPVDHGVETYVAPLTGEPDLSGEFAPGGGPRGPPGPDRPDRAAAGGDPAPDHESRCRSCGASGAAEGGFCRECLAAGGE